MSPRYTIARPSNIRQAWRRWFAQRSRTVGHCPYCGVQMTLRDNEVLAPTTITLDHIVPQCKGGLETVDACRACNLDKGPLTINEWRAVLSVRHCTVCIFWYERVLIRAWIALSCHCVISTIIL